MKKLFLSLTFVLFTFSASINATENHNYSVQEDIVEYDDTQPCALYAEYMGREFEKYGLNYWNGYFGGYADCIGTLYT